MWGPPIILSAHASADTRCRRSRTGSRPPCAGNSAQERIAYHIPDAAAASIRALSSSLSLYRKFYRSRCGPSERILEFPSTADGARQHEQIVAANLFCRSCSMASRQQSRLLETTLLVVSLRLIRFAELQCHALYSLRL
jgi:hypothetical protein